MSENTTTAYRMVKALNVLLSQNDLPEVPTQYGYNELRKGRVTGQEGPSQKPTVEEAQGWIRDQFEARKNGTRKHGASVNELLAGIDG